jgi:hypothetical protein
MAEDLRMQFLPMGLMIRQDQPDLMTEVVTQAEEQVLNLILQEERAKVTMSITRGHARVMQVLIQSLAEQAQEATRRDLQEAVTLTALRLTMRRQEASPTTQLLPGLILHQEASLIVRLPEHTARQVIVRRQEVTAHHLVVAEAVEQLVHLREDRDNLEILPMLKIQNPARAIFLQGFRLKKC